MLLQCCGFKQQPYESAAVLMLQGFDNNVLGHQGPGPWLSKTGLEALIGLLESF
jgi:hypothetical protein